MTKIKKFRKYLRISRRYLDALGSSHDGGEHGRVLAVSAGVRIQRHETRNALSVGAVHLKRKNMRVKIHKILPHMILGQESMSS